jgi:hypothetical protein
MINNVLGDISFYEKYGSYPTIFSSPNNRVKVHLEYVLSKLKEVKTNSFRESTIKNLEEYINNGVFPQSIDSEYKSGGKPCFVDNKNRLCAVGYLMFKTGDSKIISNIKEKYNYELIQDISKHSKEINGLEEWIKNSGLSLEELK